MPHIPTNQFHIRLLITDSTSFLCESEKNIKRKKGLKPDVIYDGHAILNARITAYANGFNHSYKCSYGFQSKHVGSAAAVNTV